MAYRIVICVDIEADSLELAYGKLYDFMKHEAPVGWDRRDLDWESTDEWFDDEHAEPQDPDVLQAARMAVFKDRNPNEF